MNAFISDSTTSIKFPFGSIEIREEVSYEEMFLMAEIENDKTKITDVIEKFIVSWDFKNDDGKDIPVNRENIKNLKMECIEKILNSITVGVTKKTEQVKKN